MWLRRASPSVTIGKNWLLLLYHPLEFYDEVQRRSGLPSLFLRCSPVFSALPYSLPLPFLCFSSFKLFFQFIHSRNYSPIPTHSQTSTLALYLGISAGRNLEPRAFQIARALRVYTIPCVRRPHARRLACAHSNRAVIREKHSYKSFFITSSHLAENLQSVSPFMSLSIGMRLKTPPKSQKASHVNFSMTSQ